MKRNVGISRRLLPLLENDRRIAELFHGLAFSLPGSPVMYYGDEIGMGDNIYLGDRDSVRTPMQWTLTATAGSRPPTSPSCTPRPDGPGARLPGRERRVAAAQLRARSSTGCSADPAQAAPRVRGRLLRGARRGNPRCSPTCASRDRAGLGGRHRAGA
ncbi:MAG: hypothetical protein R2711_19340 [Acidimicrobiales bacterium]